MRKLVLIRHAKAERAAASGDDIDRRLTERGRADAALIGTVLTQAGVKANSALVSAAARTRETWTESGLGRPEAELSVSLSLYNASSGELRRAMNLAADAADTLVMVGHNPGLHQFALDLLTEAAASGAVMDRVRARFPTATAIVFDFDAAERPRYGGLYLVKDHGGGGED